MARPASEHPTALELEILKVLWKIGPQPVSVVRHALATGRARRKLAHTSVITMLNIMVDKALVARRREGKVYVYSPRVSEPAVGRRMLGDLVQRLFDGSAAATMLRLLETADIDAAEVKQLRQLLNRKAKEQSP